MKKIIVPALCSLLAMLAFINPSPQLKGKWRFAGGIYNGKPEGSTEGYLLQRVYTDQGFNAYLLASGSKPEKYQSGKYVLSGSKYTETETYSMQPSKLTNKPVLYQLSRRKDTLILKGKLPTGMQVEEYWVRVK
ncbi:hypothetical protein [Mucilaginibacter sp. CSA2-8R]|uniref:hypothetical protein n=1 Tax=Mucilaginibacter sp. CSA2-8R TaxID=3141542 RepID=UPI00315C954B